MDAPDVTAAAADPANVLGRYVRTMRLGAGGMGEVWKAWDRDLARWVAVKLLRGTDAEEIARFKREAQTAAKLNHPNIAAVYDVGEDNGRHYIAMQLIEGQSLLTYPRDDRRRLVAIMRDAARAIACAHERGIVHRDLKPANLMVERGRVYVLDFGLAKQVDAGASLTASGMMLGTPAYMSPEAAQGRVHLVDARSDVYGLGAILYELLSDRPPFRDETIYDLLVKVVTEDPKPLPPNVDRDLGTIAMKCLEKDRARRYAGANEVADDLDRWLRGDPISARPRSTFYKLRTFAARRAGVLAAVVVPLAAAAVLGILWLSQRREPAVFDPIRARLLSLPDTPEAWRRGLQLIDEGLARFDGSWDAWLRKGELHEKLGEIDAALDAFRKAYEANPRIAAAHYQRGRILMDVRQKNDDALREFEAALRVEEDNEYALVGRARIAMLRGQHPEVLSILDRVEPIGRHVEDMHFLRGIVHADRAYGRFDPAKAIASFSEAIRLGPRHAASWDNRGTARGMNGDHAGAVEDHTRAIELNPNFATAHQNRGIARRAAGDAEHAIADFTRAIELNPSLHKAFANRAVLRHERGDQEGALADGGRAIALNGAYALSFEARGAAREETGDGDGALADYARAIEIEPDNPRVFARRAALRMRTGDLPGAREDIERAIRCGEPYAGSFAIRGQLHGKTGNPQAAIADFTHAIELDPGAAAAYGLRAEARRATGDLDGALADCTEALARDPRMGAAYETRGLVHLAREQFEEAIAAFDRTIEFGQRVGMAHFHRGQARMRRGNAEGALADFDAAIRLEPRVPESYVSRGIWRAANGQASGAVTDFERALQVAPADWRHRKRVEEMLARARGK